MARRPLERPRPLPLAAQPLAATITGGRREVRMTAGPATRAALEAAGARAASTGTTVHLPARPTSRPRDLGALAHELHHVAARSGGVRFLLERPVHHDREERDASRAGRAVEAAVARTSVRGGRPTAVGDLPVGGMGAVLGILRDVIDGHATGPTATPTTGRSPDHPQVPPAGGGSATPSEVLRAAGAPPPSGRDAGGGTNDGAGAAPDSMGGGGVATRPDGGGGPVDALSAGPGDSAALLADLVEALEERVLFELERRGGRYAGEF